ncbi:hypothetical protein OESDEN_00753 [Oesophagostomum dentatum]|uniref:Uncharacterized protein n=1 Tax=Oesophagostomum dentatum TaxID=61180 RepID=A0A0B1TPT7_OESDE|nr:hypothetical protein OESDEN_00753 [Oesophagostomum dentatum]
MKQCLSYKVHMLTYQPEFFTTYCRLSVCIDHFVMISQYEQRQCLLEKDADVYQTLIDCLVTHQKELDEIWSQTRWLTRIATEARDKQSK